jgi:hypothetical protein
VRISSAPVEPSTSRATAPRPDLPTASTSAPTWSACSASRAHGAPSCIAAWTSRPGCARRQALTSATNWSSMRSRSYSSGPVSSGNHPATAVGVLCTTTRTTCSGQPRAAHSPAAQRTAQRARSVPSKPTTTPCHRLNVRSLGYIRHSFPTAGWSASRSAQADQGEADHRDTDDGVVHGGAQQAIRGPVLQGERSDGQLAMTLEARR